MEENKSLENLDNLENKSKINLEDITDNIPKKSGKILRNTEEYRQKKRDEQKIRYAKNKEQIKEKNKKYYWEKKKPNKPLKKEPVINKQELMLDIIRVEEQFDSIKAKLKTMKKLCSKLKIISK
ncbi:MAG TPA: hypothetical protein VN703_00255 [Candidatus Sulfopaludibacter sp.]|nr:hypothetical protein [Candidatus Sulfopaludibacter sp.]